MAIYKQDIVDIELNSGSIHRTFLTRTIGEGDDLANRFGIRALRDGVPENLGGTCVGYFIRADGDTIAVPGVVSGNEAYVTLPASCYAVEGQFALAIKVSGSSVVGTMRIVDGVVCNTTTDVIVDPGTIIPSIDDLIAAIEAATASLPADYSSIWDSLAPNFSTSENYSVGDLVTYDGRVWKFTAAHAGTWDAGDAEAVSLGQELSAAMQLQRGTGLQYTVSHNDGYDIYELAELIPAGTPVTIRVNLSSGETDTAKTSKVRAVTSTYSQQISMDRSVTRDTDHYLMFTAQYPVKRIYLLASNNTANSAGLSLTVNKFDILYGHKVIPDDGFDASDGVMEMLGIYGECRLRTGVYTIEKPFKMPDRTLLSGTGDNCILRLAEELPAVSVSKSDDTAANYVPYSSAGSGDLKIPELAPGFYKFVINVSISAPIPTAAQSTIKIGSNTSYSSDIASISIDRNRAVTGYFFTDKTVRSFYVLAGIGTSSGVDITVNSLSIERVGSVLAMSAGCGIQNICISGADEEVNTGTVHSMTLGNRNGIVWYGEMQGGYITGCRIENFDGSGIICASSDTPPHQSPRISDCYLINNGCGLNIAIRSEYLKVSNNMFIYNGYGCINKGGNNAFSNCGFDRNGQGMQVDEVDSGNGGHGQITGCTFNHSNNNTGYGLIIENPGRMLVGNCNFYYSKLRLVGGNGNTITGCGFGSSSGIEISGGTCSVFSGCIMRDSTHVPITIENNTAVKFSGCYYRSGAEVVPEVV